MVPWNIVAPKNELRPWSIRMSSILKMLCISTVTPRTFWLWGIERLAFLDARDKNGMAEKSSRTGPKPQLILGRKTRGTKGNMPEIAWNMIVKWLIQPLDFEIPKPQKKNWPLAATARTASLEPPAWDSAGAELSWAKHERSIPKVKRLRVKQRTSWHGQNLPLTDTSVSKIA